MDATAPVPWLWCALLPVSRRLAGCALAGHRPTARPLGSWWTPDRVHLSRQSIKQSPSAGGIPNCLQPTHLCDGPLIMLVEFFVRLEHFITCPFSRTRHGVWLNSYGVRFETPDPMTHARTLRGRFGCANCHASARLHDVHASHVRYLAGQKRDRFPYDVRA